jgi:hypothetical protein
MRSKAAAATAILLACVICSPVLVSAESPPVGAQCPVTLPSDRPVAGAPWSDDEDSSFGWYGSENLAAFLPRDGHWVGMGAERNYFDKFWWWRSGYRADEEPNPDLSISAVRLDGSAPVVEIDDATNAFGEGWQSMLVGMEFPTAGCWEVRGTYNGTEQLVLVLLVGNR